MLQKKENGLASTTDEKLQALAKTVDTLVAEVKSLRGEIGSTERQHRPDETVAISRPAQDDKISWSNSEKVHQLKASLCIKKKETPIDMQALTKIAIDNKIQVAKTVVKENGDVFMDLPSVETREKLLPLLSSNNDIVKVESKLPTITIGNVSEFKDREKFLEKVMNQNPLISEKVENGSVFNIIYSKELTPRNRSDTDTKYQVVARVSNDIRELIKINGDRIFTDLISHPVKDRFYVKRCNKCQGFGHYHAECKSSPCCAFCESADHKSSDCPLKGSADKSNFKCVNCKKAGTTATGHSAHWGQCPVFLDKQNGVKQSIPYYQSKNCLPHVVEHVK